MSFFRILGVGPVLALILAVALTAGGAVEKTGDRLRLALPLLGLVCAAANGQGIKYVGRYLIMETAINIPKLLLGDAQINRRPNGGGQGFPSGSTAVATFGAVGASGTCLKHSPAAQALVMLAAGFTGASRLEAQAHNAWQVLAGAVVGWLAQYLALTGFDRIFRRAVLATGGAVRGIWRRVAAWLPFLGLLLLLGWARPAQAEFEISVYTGTQFVKSGQVSGNDPTGVGPFEFDASWDARSLDVPIYYGIRGTYWRNEAWGYLVEFNHSMAYADGETLAATGFQSLSFSHGLNSLVFGVSRRWLNQWGRFTPRIALAVGANYTHVEVQTTATSAFTNEYQTGGLAVMWMGGVSYDLSENWRLLAEYRGAYHSLDADLSGGGSIKTNFQTNSLNLGLSYAF